MLDYQDRYAALLAKSAAETRQAMLLEYGRPGFSPAAPQPVRSGSRDPHLLETVARSVAATPMTRPEIRATVEAKVGRQISDHTLLKMLNRLCQDGRLARGAFRSEGFARLATYIAAEA